VNFLSLVASACALWWGLSCALHVGSALAALLQPALRRRRATNAEQPPVSVIVPVKGLEPDLAAAFASVYAQDYPSFEVLISASDESAPAIGLARTVSERHPRTRTRIICKDVRVAVSPKLNNLVAPLAAAEHELIFVKDSNIHLEPGQLAHFVRNLAPGVGLVVAVPVAIGAENAAAEIEAAFMNGYQARLLLAGSALGLGFGHGKIMLFDRREFARAGGVAAIAWGLTEDHPLSQAFARIGLRTVFAAETIRQVLGSRRLGDVWNRQLRWMVCRRQMEPWAFYLEPLFNSLLAAAAGAGAAALLGLPWWLLAASTLLLWLALEALLAALKGWRWSWRSAAAALGRDLVFIALWLRTWRVRTVLWGDLPLEVRRRAA
jgi:ceramide glucosyltransferase